MLLAGTASARDQGVGKPRHRDPDQRTTVHRAQLACVCTVSPGCGTPRPQDKLHQLVVMQEPTGSSHLVPAIMPPAWPRLCPKVQQEALVQTSSLFDSNDE